MKPLAFFLMMGIAACGSRTPLGEEPGADATPPVDDRDRHERFIGLWAVEQPTHALYEVTHYQFQPDGTLITGSSMPSDCTGHLSQHCVTGSVANCVPTSTVRCEGTITCVFGDEWYSLDSSTLIILGDCSDGRPRETRLAFNSDSSSNTEWGGGGATLVSVDNETSWSHDNWDWVFRKCPDGTTESTCTPGG